MSTDIPTIETKKEITDLKNKFKKQEDALIQSGLVRLLEAKLKEIGDKSTKYHFNFYISKDSKKKGAFIDIFGKNKEGKYKKIGKEKIAIIDNGKIGLHKNIPKEGGGFNKKFDFRRTWNGN